MAMKNKQAVHRTAKGKVVDMDMLRQRNELTPAVGNAKVNARGDELGPGGKIIRGRAEIIRDYYEDNPAPVADEARTPSKASAPVAEEEKPATKTTRSSRAQKKVEETENLPTAAELAEFDDDEWVEDENGDFVKKGDV